MSKFDEIRDQYNKLLEAEGAYWLRLERARRLLRNAFGEYLGVDADEKVGVRGEPRLWFGGKKGFSGKSEHDLVRESNELVFTINLIIDETDTSSPPNDFAFRIHLKYVGGIYMVREGSSITWLTIYEEDFTPFFDHLWKKLKEKMNTFERL